MSHLIEPLRNETLSGALARLRRSHRFLVRRIEESAVSSADDPNWGITMKRSGVSLVGSNRPPDIGKDSEKLGELLNMMATVERLIATLGWFECQKDFADTLVRECHPATSDAQDANDLVLTDRAGGTVARVEVCDIVGPKDGNKKEESCLLKLGCLDVVPGDGIRRFIGTSPEFAEHLCRKRRRPARYTFSRRDAGDDSQTMIMELVHTSA